MWCGYCPRGVVGMEMAEEAFGDKFVGIAVHYGNTSTMVDYLVAADKCYSTVITNNVSGFPSAMLDRGEVIDPYYGSTQNTAFGIKSDMQTQLNKKAYADLTLTPVWTDEDKTAVNIHTEVNFIYSCDDATSPYSLGYVLVADSLYKSSWYQSNYFNGGSGDSNLSYWYSAGSYVTGLKFNHVAIKGAGVTSGLSGSVPTPFTANEPVVHDYSITLPSSTALVQDKDYIHVVAILFNNSTGAVENVIKAEIADATGITTISDGTNKNAELRAIYNLKGQRLTQPQKGVNVFQYTDGRSERVLVR